MLSRIHNFTFYPNFNPDRDNIFVAPNSDFYPIIPPSTGYIITEDNNFIITEDNNRMITE
jgi:hypothetical protein